jgi:hypothetical protein
MFFGQKAGCAQSLREVGRSIVPVQLPLEGFAALGEYPHLPGDQLVELATLEAFEVAILDHPAVREADRAQQRAVALDANTLRKPVMHVRAQLRVIGAEQSTKVLVPHSGDPMFGLRPVGRSLRGSAAVRRLRPEPRRCEQAQASSRCDRLEPSMHVQLPEDAPEVVAYRLGGERELLRDL